MGQVRLSIPPHDWWTIVTRGQIAHVVIECPVQPYPVPEGIATQIGDVFVPASECRVVRMWYEPAFDAVIVQLEHDKFPKLARGAEAMTAKVRLVPATPGEKSVHVDALAKLPEPVVRTVTRAIQLPEEP